MFVSAVSLCGVSATTMPITFQCEYFTNKYDTETTGKYPEVYTYKSPREVQKPESLLQEADYCLLQC